MNGTKGGGKRREERRLVIFQLSIIAFSVYSKGIIATCYFKHTNAVGKKMGRNANRIA
jgi:hypothetical protein